MTSPQPFSIRIFVSDGNPEGLRLVDRSNWTGRAVVFPRVLLPDVKSREEFESTGVYLLVGPDPAGDKSLLHIGEGDPVRPRLESHYAKKDFWTWTVFFVSKDVSLNKAHVQYLESRLIQLAAEAKRVSLENQTVPQPPTLSEPDMADMETFLAYMLSIFPLLGLNAFDKAPARKQKRQLLSLSAKGISAKGYESSRGFIAEARATAVMVEVPSIHHYLKVQRHDLLEKGVLAVEGQHYVLTQDYIFNSPSTAAGVLLGRSANGRVEWRDDAGRTLKELQEAQAGGAPDD